MEEMLPFACRKPTRIKNFDYSSHNFYFITICTDHKKCIFGTTDKLNLVGKIAMNEIEKIDSHYDGVYIDKYVVMPNHIHAIVILEMKEGQKGNTTLNSIVGSYKAGVTRRVRQIIPEFTVWQRSFHDHIIRGQKDYEKIWNYIDGNPQKWEDDCFYISESKL